MKKIVILAGLSLCLSLTACAKADKVENKIGKKNLVEETLNKQIEKANEAKEEEKEEEARSEEKEPTKEEAEESLRKGEEIKERKPEKKEEKAEKKIEKLEKKEKKKEKKEEVKPQEEKEWNSEEELIKEQADKLNEEGTQSPDTNPTDESLDGNNFAGQFGEDEFNKMIAEARKTKKNGEFDYDLSEMNGDMVYATVFLMMTDPDSFAGKKFKMKGQYYAAYYEPTKKHYHYCFISDAAGCCAQGIEFAVDESLEYPDDFPKDASDIVVTGVFEKYTEEDKVFVRLKNAAMTVMENKKN